MAVERIEEYRQKNGVDILKVFCKPTKAFPNGGYFYAPIEALNLVQKYGWSLSRDRKRIYVVIRTWGTSYSFHRELYNMYFGYYADCLDHINHVGIDNINQNINVVTTQQNGFNKFVRGYNCNYKHNIFIPQLVLDYQSYQPFSVIHKEDEVCIQQNYLEQVWLKDKMQDQYYMFDFKKYRKGAENILDLERTGLISEEETTYRHIMRYADNAWYYLRYGLQDYFQQYNIPIPKYSLDENGFMIHPITGQKLCPFIK